MSNQRVINDFISANDDNTMIDVIKYKECKITHLYYAKITVAVIDMYGSLSINYRSGYSERLYTLLDDLFLAWCPDYPAVAVDLTERDAWIDFGKRGIKNLTDQEIADIYKVYQV